MKKLFLKSGQELSEVAFGALGVALVLMAPRNLLSAPYLLAVGCWAVTDYFKEDSYIERLAELVY